MPLPNNFSDSKHVKEVVRSVINKMVRLEFMEPNEVNWEPNITTPKASLRKACTHDVKDSLILTVARLLIFYLIKGKLKDLIGNGNSYSDEQTEMKSRLVKHPKIILYFYQDKDAVPPGNFPLKATVGFRLMDESVSSFTEAKACILANKIKAEFCTAGKGNTHRKGKYMATYYDYELGYRINALVLNKQEGIDLVKAVLRIQNHVYDPDRFQLNEPERNSENNPTGTITVMGKQVAKPRWRPTAIMRFCFAKVRLLPNVPEKVILDVSGVHLDALVK